MTLDDTSDIPISLYDRKITISRETGMDVIKSSLQKHIERNLIEYLYYIQDLRSILTDLQSRSEPVIGLDVGCGRAVAAKQIEKHFKIKMKGVDLIEYPENPEKPHLDRNDITIASLQDANFPKESFDLLIAVGSLDTSGTIEEDGVRMLELMKPNGYAIIAFVTRSHDAEMETVLRFAEEHNITLQPAKPNKDNLPIYIFRKPIENA